MGFLTWSTTLVDVVNGVFDVVNHVGGRGQPRKMCLRIRTGNKKDAHITKEIDYAIPNKINLRFGGLEVHIERLSVA